MNMAAATLLELLRVEVKGLVRLVQSPPLTQTEDRRTMKGDGLHPARLFETEDSNREWGVCASSETEYPLSAGGSCQTKPVAKGSAFMLASGHLRVQLAVHWSSEVRKRGQNQITGQSYYYVSIVQYPQ